MSGHSPTICVLGQHELDYPRNVSVQRLMQQAGCRTVVCHSRTPFPIRHVAILEQYLRSFRDVDVVWVTEGGHRLMPFVKAAALLTGRPVIFDPFTSRYDTRVEDRKLYRPDSVMAWVSRFQDWSGCRSADVLVFDTDEHRRYFEHHYRTRVPAHVLEIGVDETVFTPRPLLGRAPDEPLRVLFFGTYIPLQGVEHIVEAAAALEPEGDVVFELVGRGQTFAAVERELAARRLRSITLVPRLSPPELAHRIARAHVCLGIFGTTVKAANVVPNKVVQCAAVGRPIVTRRSPAIERYFGDDAAVLVEPGHGHALADALRRLRDDSGLRERLAAGSRRVFERSFSEAALLCKMQAILGSALTYTPR